MGTPDKLDEAHQLLVDGVTALVSGEQWQAMLEATARFHSYSPNNVLLLMLQGAEGRVAGYRTWQRIPARDGGMCQVAKGARALRILAPMVGRPPAPDDGDKREPGATPEREPGPKRLYGFRVVSVFDESQLVSPPAIEEVAPTLLEGHGPAGVYDALAAQVVAAGFEVTHDPAIAPANGTTNYLTRIVTLREGMSPAQRCKTMAHELAHVRLHDPSGPGAPLPRSQKEVEAESVAWLVTHHAGLVADGYSFPYVALWSGGQVERVRAVIDRAVPTARSITASLDQTLARPLALTPAKATPATAVPGGRGGIAAPGRELLAGQAAGGPGLADPPGSEPKGQTPEESPDVVFARSVTRRRQKPPRLEPPGLGLS
jgi:hypothetical protein